MSKTKCFTMFAAILAVLIVVSVYAPLAVGCGRWDRKPPKIHWVMQHPKVPEYEDSVLVLAYITDSKSGVANATLCCILNGEQKFEIGMDRNGSLFFAEIPALPYNSTLAYKVCAFDKAGNKACSGEYIYVVGDFHPPTITFIKQFPAKPNYNETVMVIANATEPTNASGVKELCLSYSTGVDWTTMVMTQNGTMYTATIPSFPYGTTVQYKVSAVDHAGNIASLDLCSYSVEDQYLPVAVFLMPKNGSFLSKTVNVTFYVYDDNLCEAKLMLDDVLLNLWNQTGTHTYVIDAVALNDGVHELKLRALDKAGNVVESTLSIVVDNTPPEAAILQPLDGSFVSGLVLVEVLSDDANFDHIELTINEAVHTWEAKTQIYVWKTAEYGDGEYRITLVAVDKAGNKAEKQVIVVVDNTAPTINSVTWTPETPATNRTVTVTAQITEIGSGIRSVSLWFKRLGEEWQKISMALQDGNWTATIRGFEEGSTVIFYVECVDKAGNTARSAENYYVVKAVTAEGFAGIPLYWLALAVLAIFAVLASTAYYLHLKRRKRTPTATTFLASSL
ncbi:MAG: Ig-like domain-containing protein [Candidatus Bathyarchaeia archaeon]